MKLDRRSTKTLISGTILLLVFSVGYLFVSAINAHKSKTAYALLLLPLVLIVIGLFSRIRIQTLVCLILLLFWVPAGLYIYNLFLFEISVYAISILLVIQSVHSHSEKLKSYLINFPWFPFILYIFGALLTWRLSTRVGGELITIRAMCVIPLALSVLIFLTIQSSADAERYLWMITTSAAALGLVFLGGRYFFSKYITLSDYAIDSGRLSMILIIPHLGTLRMLPQSTANWYGYLFVFAYSIWIFHSSFAQRTYAAFLCLLFSCIVLVTQGRGGAVQAALGAAVVSVYAAFNIRLLNIKGVWIKFGFVCLVVIGGLWYLSIHSTNVGFYQHGISLFVNPQGDENLLYRFQGWSNGIRLFLANPILGIGLRGIQTPWGLDTAEILNYFLFNLLSYGLLGFVGIMWILIKFFSTFWKGLRAGDRVTRMICIASVGGMLGFFFGMQPLDPYSNVIVWAPLLIAFAVSTLEENQSLMTPK
jgi:hypothetical protein